MILQKTNPCPSLLSCCQLIRGLNKASANFDGIHLTSHLLQNLPESPAKTFISARCPQLTFDLLQNFVITVWFFSHPPITSSAMPLTPASSHKNSSGLCLSRSSCLLLCRCFFFRLLHDVIVGSLQILDLLPDANKCVRNLFHYCIQVIYHSSHFWNDL